MRASAERLNCFTSSSLLAMGKEGDIPAPLPVLCVLGFWVAIRNMQRLCAAVRSLSGHFERYCAFINNNFAGVLLVLSISQQNERQKKKEKRKTCTPRPSASSSLIRQSAVRSLNGIWKFPSIKQAFDIFVSKQTQRSCISCDTELQYSVFCLPLSPFPCAFLSSPPPAPIAGKLIPEASDNSRVFFKLSAFVRHLRGLLSCPGLPRHTMWKMQEFMDCWVLSCCTFLSEGN